MMVCSGERGASNLKVFLLLLVIFSVVHIGIKWLSVNMDFWRLEDDIKSKATMGQVLKDDEIKNDLAVKAKGYDLPLTAENFLILRHEDRQIMTITTAWEVEVRYFWGVCGERCVQTYHFEPKGEGSYAAK
ncbi:MAG: hypothetical protein OEW15_12245 [Nitrospirota bacterium]|nr:hypothetical protein [Nitrospirota bacterium]